MDHADVLVVGGSVAGLQAALTLGRARRRVVLVDDGRPRNLPARHVHNFFGQAGPAPADLLASARSMLEPHGVCLVQDRVEHVEVRGDAPALRARAANGSHWSARAMVLATGLRDELPDVPGLSELWGEQVVACPHCHGWEVRDQPLAQLGLRGLPERAVARALLLSRWSSDVLLFTDGDEIEPGDLDRLTAAGVRVRTERVARVLPGESGVDVVLASGAGVPRRAVFVVTRQHQQSDLADRLGCRLTAAGPLAGAVETDGSGRTSVSGVWAAGTTTVPTLLAIGAAGHASGVAMAVHSALLEQDLAAAL